MRWEKVKVKAIGIEGAGDVYGEKVGHTCNLIKGANFSISSVDTVKIICETN